MKDVNLISAAGWVNKGSKAEIRFPTRGGTVVLQIGEYFTAIAAVSQSALFRFLARAKEALEGAGHPTSILCVLPKNN